MGKGTDPLAFFKVAEKRALEMLIQKPSAPLPEAVENQTDEIVRFAQKNTPEVSLKSHVIPKLLNHRPAPIRI